MLVMVSTIFIFIKLGEKKMKKRTVSLFLALCLTATALAGCTGNNGTAGSATGSNTSAANGPKKEISVISFERGKCSAEEGSMEDNRWTKWTNENAPVNVKWIPIPRTESVTKTNALFASGEAPDLVWEFSKSFMDGLNNQGVIQPVDEYIEKYSTTYKKYLEENKDLKPFVTADDGKMYAFTSRRNQTQVANHAMWIRQDWLDNLGLKTPTTIDELYNVAKKFTQNDPDKNGQNDTFGIGFNYNWTGIMKAIYGEPSLSMVVDKDGKMTDWTDSQAYADCLQMEKNFDSEGLIDPEFITDTNFERAKQLFTTGKIGIYMSSVTIDTEWRSLMQNVPDANLVPLASVSTKYGINGLFQEPQAFRVICMNKDAKDPEACIKFLDWCLDTGWETYTYGLEGVHYKLVNGIPQAIDTDKNNKEIGYSVEYALLTDQKIDNMTEWFKVTSAQDDLSQKGAVIKAKSYDTALKNTFKRYVAFLPATDKSAQYSTDSSASIGAIETKVRTDSSYSVNQAMADLKALKESLNYAAVMQERQDWYTKNKDVLALVK